MEKVRKEGRGGFLFVIFLLILDFLGYHCNGHLYQNNTCHGFGPTFTNGDRFSMIFFEKIRVYFA